MISVYPKWLSWRPTTNIYKFATIEKVAQEDLDPPAKERERDGEGVSAGQILRKAFILKPRTWMGPIKWRNIFYVPK